MPRTPLPHLWSTVTLARHRFQPLNLDHPQIAARILGDLEAGIAVYYLLSWQALLRETRRPYRPLLPPDDLPCLRFDADAPEPERAHGRARRRHLWRGGLVPNLWEDKA